MNDEKLNKMDLCRHLLPEPGGEVVGELIAELRGAQGRIDAAHTRIADLEAANKECVDTAKKLIFDSVKMMKDCANLEDLANSERAAYMLALSDVLIIIDSTDVSQAAIAKANGGANT